MRAYMFDTNSAFWFLCLGTFFTVMYAASYFCKTIVTKRGSELREEIKLPNDLLFLQNVPDEKSRMLAEAMAKELIWRGNASLFLFARFTEYHYIAIIAALSSGAFGGIATFLISSYGWDHANAALRGFFVGSAASLPFWLTVMQVFKYTESITKHEAIYTACWALLSDLKRMVLVPPELGDKDRPFSLPTYLGDIGGQIRDIRGIGIAFDGSRIGVTKIELPS